MNETNKMQMVKLCVHCSIHQQSHCLFAHITLLPCFALHEVSACKGAGGEWGYGGECIIMHGNAAGALPSSLSSSSSSSFTMWVFGCVNLRDDERTRIVRDLIIFLYFWSAWDARNCVSAHNRRIEDEEEFAVVLPMITLTVLGIFPFPHNCRAMLMSSSGV